MDPSLGYPSRIPIAGRDCSREWSKHYCRRLSRMISQINTVSLSIEMSYGNPLVNLSNLIGDLGGNLQQRLLIHLEFGEVHSQNTFLGVCMVLIMMLKRREINQVFLKYLLWLHSFKISEIRIRSCINMITVFPI